MKSLKESILKSVKAGVYSLITDWCDKHIIDNRKFPNGTKVYNITNDNRVCGEDIILYDHKKDIVETIPDYIRFGSIDNAFSIGNAINTMTQEQIPTYAKFVFINEAEKLDKDFHFVVGHHFGASTRIMKNKIFAKGFKNLTIELKDSNDPHSSINFAYSKLRFKNLFNLHVIGNFEMLNIACTPAGETLHKLFKESQKEKQSESHSINIDNFIKTTLPEIESHFRSIHTGKETFLKNQAGIWF